MYLQYNFFAYRYEIMTSMENKLMGYKPQNYISSSESEGEDSDACGSNNIKESVASTEPATSTTAGSLRTSRGSKVGKFTGKADT